MVRILVDGNGVKVMDLGSIPNISTKVFWSSLKYFGGDEMDFDIAIERLQERIVLRLKTKTKASGCLWYITSVSTSVSTLVSNISSKSIIGSSNLEFLGGVGG